MLGPKMFGPQKRLNPNFSSKFFFCLKHGRSIIFWIREVKKNLCSNFFVQIIVSPENLWSKKKGLFKKKFWSKKYKIGSKKEWLKFGQNQNRIEIFHCTETGTNVIETNVPKTVTNSCRWSN